MSNLEFLAAETKSQRAKALLERQPWEHGWKFNLPGYELLQGDIPDKLIYRLLVRHRMARTIWLNAYHSTRKWMNKEKHRAFCWRLLAQCALANGWTENQAEYLLAAWRHQHWVQFPRCRACKCPQHGLGGHDGGQRKVSSRKGS